MYSPRRLRPTQDPNCSFISNSSHLRVLMLVMAGDKQMIFDPLTVVKRSVPKETGSPFGSPRSKQTK
jgi:hypothetical protein